jgi:hypothetical protein
VPKRGPLTIVGHSTPITFQQKNGQKNWRFRAVL